MSITSCDWAVIHPLCFVNSKVRKKLHIPPLPTTTKHTNRTECVPMSMLIVTSQASRRCSEATWCLCIDCLEHSWSYYSLNSPAACCWTAEGSIFHRSNRIQNLNMDASMMVLNEAHISFVFLNCSCQWMSNVQEHMVLWPIPCWLWSTELSSNIYIELSSPPAKGCQKHFSCFCWGESKGGSFSLSISFTSTQDWFSSEDENSRSPLMFPSTFSAVKKTWWSKKMWKTRKRKCLPSAGINTTALWTSVDVTMIKCIHAMYLWEPLSFLLAGLSLFYFCCYKHDFWQIWTY